MRTFNHYEAEIVKTCVEKNICTIEMIFTFYSGISRSQFYELGLNKSDTIKKAIDDNKNRTKLSLLEKWLNSNNPTLQLALYKLLSTEEERRMLTMNFTDYTSNGEQVKHIVLNLGTGIKPES